MSMEMSETRPHHLGIAGTMTPLGLAAVGAGLGMTVYGKPESLLAVTTAILGVVAMVLAGLCISRRPKDSLTLLLAGGTAVLAGFATNPAWDSIRLMQWVMAGTAIVCAGIVLLPQTGQRIAFSLLVLYHFAGIGSAVTSPPPTPWLTGQLWSRVFRPHLEFNYVNNAYQFYSPQPGPAQVLWFCITGTDGQSRWYKTPIKGELLDPLGTEYFRRLSLTERANQNAPVGPNRDAQFARQSLAHDFPLLPDVLALESPQYRMPNEHGRHIIRGYAEHAARVLGTGRKKTDGSPVPVGSVKIYLAQHQMLGQYAYQKGEDPYAPETYRPYYVGQFDGQGREMMNDFEGSLLYWIIPIYRVPLGDPKGELRNYVAVHAGSDPFDPALAWRVEQ
jgi:hypothetical protein